MKVDQPDELRACIPAVSWCVFFFCVGQARGAARLRLRQRCSRTCTTTTTRFACTLRNLFSRVFCLDDRNQTGARD